MNVFEKLDALGAADGPDTKTVDVTIGNVTQTFTIRRMSFQEAQEINAIPFDLDDAGNSKLSRGKLPARNSAVIAASVINEDGTPALTVEQAANLKADIGLQLLRAANEFNNLGAKPVETAAKNSSATASVATS